MYSNGYNGYIQYLLPLQNCLFYNNTPKIILLDYECVLVWPYGKFGILGNLGNGSESSEFSMCAYVTDGKLGTKKLENLDIIACNLQIQTKIK